MKTVWETNDRQGKKWFVEKPEFYAGHDIFTGKRSKSFPRPRKVRIIRRFKAKVIGSMAGCYGYPKVIQAAPERKTS